MSRKAVCNMDCFNCIYPDCINSYSPTKEESKLIASIHETYEKSVFKRKEYRRIYREMHREEINAKKREARRRKKEAERQKEGEAIGTRMDKYSQEN